MVKIFLVKALKMHLIIVTTIPRLWLPKLHHVQIHKVTKPLTVWSDQTIQKLDFTVVVRSNDFRIACAVAQRNLWYAYVDRTLEAINVVPGTFCKDYNEKMTTKVNEDKCRKSTIKFKRQRIQKHLSSSAQTARKEAKEGTTYQTGVGLNLDMNTNRNSTKSNTNLGQPKLQEMSSEQFKEIENIVPPYTPRPVYTSRKSPI